MLKHLTLKSSIIRSSATRAVYRTTSTTSQNHLPRNITPRLFSTAVVQEEEEETTRDLSFATIQDEVNDARARYENIVKIEDTPLGFGVFAAQNFTKGDKVLSADVLKTVAVRDSHSLQKDWDKHVLIDAPARLINHSCNGNLGIQDIPDGGYDFFAMRTINEGDELSWDYESTEFEISAFEDCMCGDEKCRGKLGGFKKHGKQIKEQYGEYYGNYLKEMK